MNKSNVLIVGCGDVGSALARQLLESNDFEVWGLRRDVSQLPEGVRPIKADLTSGDLGKWPGRVDYLVYCAAADGPGEERYHKAYIQGLKNTLEQLQQVQLNPARVLFTSSTSVYHQSEGEWVDEYSVVEPKSFSGKTMLKAESLLHSTKYPTTAVRFGGIYGPGRNRLIERVRQGKGCPAFPPVYGNRIHRDDCAGILAHLIKLDKQGQTLSDVYIGVDNEPAPVYEVLQWLADQINVTLDDSNPPPARGNRRCCNKRILSSGYQFLYQDYKAGYRELICNSQAG